MGCGFHPDRFSRRSGQALFRWRINQLLETTTLDLRIACDGEDVGRMVRFTPANLESLVHDALQNASTDTRATRWRTPSRCSDRGAGTREERRSAVVALAGVLEQRRGLLRDELLSGDERSLFDIANNYDLRHRNERQRTEYDDAFLEWIFYWYLATVRLTDQLAAGGNANDS